jgi:NAD(P)-dependent dehydrogenase (short-subunit alcohol dehydrogenase family)
MSAVCRLLHAALTLAHADRLQYITSKHAVLGLTRADAIDVASESVRVNCVCPAVIDTNLGGVLPPDVVGREIDPVIYRTPMKRMGSPYEVANCVAFLCSNLASYVTGSAMTVSLTLFPTKLGFDKLAGRWRLHRNLMPVMDGVVSLYPCSGPASRS